MIAQLLYKLANRLPCRIISDKDVPYLERYYLFTALGVRFYLHRFVGSDPARGFHDHPWPWAMSIILTSYYWEVRRSGLRRVAWFNWLLGDTFHRVILPQKSVRKWVNGKLVTAADVPCWTLFFHRAENVKPWGFLKHEPTSGSATWRAHNFPQDGQSTADAWWLTVPKGRDEPRRMAA